MKSTAKPKVSLVKAPGYRNPELRKALEKSLELLGGLETCLRPGSKVFVKINYLSPASSPDEAIYTHPQFTREVLRLVKDAGAEITVGDDIPSQREGVFLASGYHEVCRELGVRLVNLKEAGFQEVHVQGKRLKTTYISRLILESDAIINLPKLKTHSFTLYTGAVKNMFGLIPHGLRLKYHRMFIRNDVFSEMLVDIFSCARPQLTIMDAVVGMEGEGPSAGTPRRVGLILAGRDAVALDAVAARTVGFDPRAVFTTVDADRRGLGSGRLEKIEVVGEEPGAVEVRDFRHSAVAVGLFRRYLPSFLYAYIQEKLTFIPEIDPRSCAACLECIRICPRSAITLRKNKVWINPGECIHCICCHETCRYRAIRLHQLALGWTIRKSAGLYRRLKSAFSG